MNTITAYKLIKYWYVFQLCLYTCTVLQHLLLFWKFDQLFHLNYYSNFYIRKNCVCLYHTINTGMTIGLKLRYFIIQYLSVICKILNVTTGRQVPFIILCMIYLHHRKYFSVQTVRIILYNWHASHAWWVTEFQTDMSNWVTVMPYILLDKVLFSLQVYHLLRFYNQHEMQQMKHHIIILIENCGLYLTVY